MCLLQWSSVSSFSTTGTSRAALGTRQTDDKILRGVWGQHNCVTLANMASWKCGGYVVVGTIVIVLIILLNFDYLPKRRLSEELELTTKSSYKEFTASTDRPSTLKLLIEKTASNSKVRSLKFHAEFI